MGMRDQKLSTTVTDGEKQDFREIAAIDGVTMSEKLRELVYDELRDRDRTPESTE
jgi:hypothetical protein